MIASVDVLFQRNDMLTAENSLTKQEAEYCKRKTMNHTHVSRNNVIATVVHAYAFVGHRGSSRVQ